MTDDKVRENRLRRMALRQGLVLRKSRRRDPRSIDYGLFWLDAKDTGKSVTPETGVGIDAIEQYLEG